MGRYINCKINNEYEMVWKYVFAEQDSEMYLINSQWGIGEYHFIRYVIDKDTQYEYVSPDELTFAEDMDVDGDILILDKKDIANLEEKIKLLKESSEQEEKKWFIAMVEAICDFAHQYPEQESFILEGEF